jgi:hypothetical protein
MTSNVSTGSIGYAGTHPTARKFLAWAPGVAYVGALAVVVIYMIINGPAIRAATESHKAEQIDQENTLFCEKFGMARGTDAFATCASYLADLRKRNEERVTRDLVGFL